MVLVMSTHHGTTGHDYTFLNLEEGLVIVRFYLMSLGLFLLVPQKKI